jgi:hypothetical protein
MCRSQALDLHLHPQPLDLFLSFQVVIANVELICLKELLYSWNWEFETNSFDFLHSFICDSLTLRKVKQEGKRKALMSLERF